MTKYDCIIVGTGPAGLGAAFFLKEKNPDLKILMLDKAPICSGGLRNDCKMNFTYPVGFPIEYWQKKEADAYLKLTEKHLQTKKILTRNNLNIYKKRAERLNVTLMDIKQIHLGTDKGVMLIRALLGELKQQGVEIALKEEMQTLDAGSKTVSTTRQTYCYENLILAPGRKGFHFLQGVMNQWEIPFLDNTIDIGIRVETPEKNYPIVQDYYDPKFLFPGKVRTFCTNSQSAYVVKEKYATKDGKPYYSVNGHAFSHERKQNGLVNFALLKTVQLTKPMASGQQFAEMLGLQAMLMGGGQPIMQRVGDYRLKKRSTRETFNQDLYSFPPTHPSCTPGDINLCIPAKILNAIWKALTLLDTIVPGILHPATIMYYPEIKSYANKPSFTDAHFCVKPGIYLIGDGAGTSRGITAAWASGIRAARGILNQKKGS